MLLSAAERKMRLYAQQVVEARLRVTHRGQAIGEVDEDALYP